MTYRRRRRALGEEPEPALPRGRGYIAVPSADVVEYVKQSVLIAVVGFGAGVAVGALLGKKIGA